MTGTDDTKTTRMSIPKTMAEALDFDDPYEALIALSRNSQEKATELSVKLIAEINENPLSESGNNNNGNGNIRSNSNILPDLLKRLPNRLDADSHPVATAIACSDSILNALTKIASGGSQVSEKIVLLEQEKRELEQNATDVETALRLRKASDAAAQSLSAQLYEQASVAIRDYTQLQKKHRLTKRAKAYAGQYTVTQLESSKKALRATLLQDYQQAVQVSDLQALGKLTPMLQMVEYEKEAVGLYLRFLKGILKNELERAASNANNNNNNNDPKQRQPTSGPPPPYIPMGRTYNAAVTILRHHLPMVSHCLYRADGDAAVIQLVNVQIEDAILPLFEQYISSRQLGRSSRNAQRIYNDLETKLESESVEGNIGGSIGGATANGSDSSQDNLDDAGFSTEIGSLADVDASMEEAVLCLQHAESYTRFIQHTVREVNKARALRYRSEQEERRMERERREWSTGMKQTGDNKEGDAKDEENDRDGDDDFSEEEEYSPLEILPVHTKLQEKIAEVGGFYSTIESTLLLVSMQRAFAISSDDPRQYSALGMASSNSNTSGGVSRMNMNTNGPLKTSIVESSLYATRRGSQRAFATGHASTASAVTNYFASCLRNVLVQYLIRRAEDLGVSALKPGEGLLEGSTGIFGTTASLGLTSRQAHQSVMGHGSALEEKQRQHQIEEGISRACATMNDLEVAAHHTKELQRLLTKSVDQGFPPKTPETEQLRVCVLSWSSVAESFSLASDQAVESLLSELKPRIRAIVTDAVGSNHGAAHGVSASSGFSSVMGGGGMTKTSADRHAVRMNYELDEDAYMMLEVSESYVSRLCTLLDEILVPLCRYLAPRLADNLVLGVLGTVSKRLEVSLKKCRFTALGALSLDSDMRDLIHYAKDRLLSNEFNSSNLVLYNACMPFSRLMQIAKLMNLDDLEDVLDLISSSKRKGNWDLKIEDSKAYLSLRVEFESDLVEQLLGAVDEE